MIDTTGRSNISITILLSRLERVLISRRINTVTIHFPNLSSNNGRQAKLENSVSVERRLHCLWIMAPAPSNTFHNRSASVANIHSHTSRLYYKASSTRSAPLKNSSKRSKLLCHPRYLYQNNIATSSSRIATLFRRLRCHLPHMLRSSLGKTITVKYANVITGMSVIMLQRGDASVVRSNRSAVSKIRRSCKSEHNKGSYYRNLRDQSVATLIVLCTVSELAGKVTSSSILVAGTER